MKNNIIWILAAILLIGCGGNERFPKGEILKSECHVVGYWQGNSEVNNRIGYKCKDSLEYWISMDGSN